MIDNSKEYILCAAWRRAKPRVQAIEGTLYKQPNAILYIELGYRHHDIAMRFGRELDMTGEGAMGFYTSHGRFVGRIEAMQIAYEAGQVDKQHAMWTEQDLDWDFEYDPMLSKVKIGDFKPLASEDLYCCSPSGNVMDE